MKKQKQVDSPFPFAYDDDHIYNKLVENKIESIRVGHYTYTIDLRHGIKNGDADCDGLTCFNSNQILMEMTLSDSRAREVLLHEIIHCILHLLGLDEANFNGQMLSCTNEFLTDVLSKHLMMLNFYNPELLKLIFK